MTLPMLLVIFSRDIFVKPRLISSMMSIVINKYIFDILCTMKLWKVLKLVENYPV